MWFLFTSSQMVYLFCNPMHISLLTLFIFIAEAPSIWTFCGQITCFIYVQKVCVPLLLHHFMLIIWLFLQIEFQDLVQTSFTYPNFACTIGFVKVEISTLIPICFQVASGKNPSYVAVPMNYLGYIALGFTCVALHSLGSSGSNSRTLCRPGSFR